MQLKYAVHWADKSAHLPVALFYPHPRGLLGDAGLTSPQRPAQLVSEVTPWVDDPQ